MLQPPKKLLDINNSILHKVCYNALALFILVETRRSEGARFDFLLVYALEFINCSFRFVD